MDFYISTNKRKGVPSMFRTLEEHVERFHGKRPGLIARMIRFKMLVFGSVLAIGTLLTIVMGLD
jgi:hypothetical protein